MKQKKSIDFKIGIRFFVLLLMIAAVMACGKSGDGANNIAPSVDAGIDQTVGSGDTVTVTGLLNDQDGTIATIKWQQLSGPEVQLAGSDTASVQFNAPVLAATDNIQLQLSATDNEGSSSSDTVTITVFSHISGMLVDDSVSGAQVEILDIFSQAVLGESTSKSDGTFRVLVDNVPEAYLVRSTGGTVAGEPLTGSMIALCTRNESLLCVVTPLTTVIWRVALPGIEESMGLEAITSQRMSATDNVASRLGIEPAEDFFTAVDPVDVSLQLIRQNILSSSLSEWVDDVLDALDGIVDDTNFKDWFPAANVNIIPSADGGGDQSVPEQSQVTLTASASSDPDGELIAFQWKQLEGPPVVLETPDQQTTKFMAPTLTAIAEIVLQLTVTDNAGGVSSDTVTITVNPINDAPIASAGGDQILRSGETCQLDGSDSSDPDGSIELYLWEQVSGPTVAISGANTSLATFVGPEVIEATEVVIRFSVEDDQGERSTDTVIVTITPPGKRKQYNYDAAGRLTEVTFDDGSSIEYLYDNNGNLLRKIINTN